MKKNMPIAIQRQILISASVYFILLFLVRPLAAQHTNTTTEEEFVDYPMIECSCTIEEIKDYKTAVYKNGDTHAYLRLLMHNGRRSEETLIYSMVMANKFHYSHAYYDVYQTIIDLADAYSTELDSVTMNMALDYLQKGATLGDVNCVYEISRLYLVGEFVTQDESTAKSFFSILYSNEDLEYRWKVFVKTYTIQNANNNREVPHDNN